ncbi:MAG: beta-N-acetylhexosaminidase [Bacteroidales bacterium]|nr:beta-N-acetylhexosaminidase [Bacteroidales bacterium]
MKRKRFSATMFSLCFCVLLTAQNINIIPQPKMVEMKEGYFTLTEKTLICFNDQQLKFLADYTSDNIRLLNKLELHVNSLTGDKKIARSINLILDNKLSIAEEGYVLSVFPKEILVQAKTSQGLFYGVQTLLQLIPVNGDRKVPSLLINDEPRFVWRGLMLDVSRHFFTIDEVKRLIDEMVVYKFNILHLHLTDDQGWRIEIKKLPELTRKGAWRVPRMGLWWDRECPKEGEEATYGGFYTQEEIKDLVRYAMQRHVNILPEIDVPGHSLAAIASYSYLSSSGLPYKVNPGCKFYGHDDNSLCAGKESTFEFLNTVFTEVAELFPFEYIHIGGDECFKGFWEKCKDCRKRMKDNGLKDANELQSYFIRRLEKMLLDKGKKLIGWDEILEGGLAPNATVMSWRGINGGIAAAKANHHVVMSPNNYAYLDLYQGDPAIEPPTYGMLRLNKVYSFEPVPEGVDPSYILGGQGNLWAESVPTFRQAEYMYWPRAFALAEVLWSPKESKDWNGFINRTEANLQRLSYEDINYSRSFYDAVITPLKDEKGHLLIQLSTEIEGLDLFYSFDNTYPDHHSLLYKNGQKLMIPKDADTFRVVTYKEGKPAGRMITVPLTDLAKRVK